MKKTYKVAILRIDATVPMTKEEEKRGKRFLKQFMVSVNAEVPPTHKMLK